MNKDQIQGNMKYLVGICQETIGHLSGNGILEKKGKHKKLEGNVQKSFGKLVAGMNKQVFRFYK